MSEPLRENYMPTLDEAIRFIKSNPMTSWEVIAKEHKLGDEDAAAVSGGRFRELWKLNGGAFDKQGRAWIEVELLPQILRRIIDSVNALDDPQSTAAQREGDRG